MPLSKCKNEIKTSISRTTCSNDTETGTRLRKNTYSWRGSPDSQRIATCSPRSLCIRWRSVLLASVSFSPSMTSSDLWRSTTQDTTLRACCNKFYRKKNENKLRGRSYYSLQKKPLMRLSESSNPCKIIEVQLKRKFYMNRWKLRVIVIFIRIRLIAVVIVRLGFFIVIGSDFDVLRVCLDLVFVQGFGETL